MFGWNLSHLLSDFDFSVALEKTEAGRLGSPLPLLTSSGFLSDVSLLFSSTADFPESPIILKVRPSHAMLKLTNLISPANRLFCCKTSQRKGRDNSLGLKF